MPRKKTTPNQTDQAKSIEVDLSGLPHVMNPSFYPLYFDESRYLVLMGGAGSGKSHFAVQKVLARCVTEKHRALTLRKIGATVNHSVWQLYKDIIEQWGWGSLIALNKTEKTIRFKNGSEIFCAGLDEREKLKSITGITLVWIEEATEFLEDDFDQTDLRLRGPNPSYRQILLSFNPISVSHWLKKRFWDNPDSMAQTHHSSVLDNQWSDPDYARILKALEFKNPSMYQVYCLGKWGRLEGLIYDMPIILTDRQWPNQSDFDDIIYGIDFGFNHPFVLTEIGLLDEEAYIRQRIYETKLTTSNFRAKLLGYYDENEDEYLDHSLFDQSPLLKLRTKPYTKKDPPPPNPDNLLSPGEKDPNWPYIVGDDQRNPDTFDMYADNAEPDRIEEIADDGWNIKPSHKGPASVRDGIDLVKSVTLYLHEDSNDLKKEFLSYSWKMDKNGDPMVPDTPVKAFDDGMDSIRYPLFSHWRCGALTKLTLGQIRDVQPS